MTTPSHLKSLQAIDLALRSGSLTKAAEALSITPAAVGQRIKALEDYLGLELIVRGRSGLKPTPALSSALTHLHAAFRELEIFGDRMDVQRGQEIHVAAPPDFAELWLKPRLARFQTAHPGILFCINGEGDVPHRAGRVDCSISFGLVRRDRTGDVLFRDFLLPVSSSENATRIQGLAAQERLEGFPLLHLDLYRDDPGAIGWRQWITQAGLQRSAPERGIRFRRLSHALDAVLSNAGLMICGLALISHLVDENQLALPYPPATGAWTDHAYQARFNLPYTRPQVERFRRWLIAESRETEAWIEKTAARRGIPRRVRQSPLSTSGSKRDGTGALSKRRKPGATGV